VLRFQRLAAVDGPVTLEQTAKKASEQQRHLDQIAGELARVCLLNGFTSVEKASSLDAV
jgi:hypothetical protein